MKLRFSSTQLEQHWQRQERQAQVCYIASGVVVTIVHTFILPGLFYVIDGFLDILLPTPAPPKQPASAKSPISRAESLESEPTRPIHPEEQPQDDIHRKLLFTVKPGGIAGYLGKLV